jgi:hypothetical protein
MSKDLPNSKTVPAKSPSIYGFMKGSVIIPPDVDLTEPVCDELCLDELVRLLGQDPED